METWKCINIEIQENGNRGMYTYKQLGNKEMHKYRNATVWI